MIELLVAPPVAQVEGLSHAEQARSLARLASAVGSCEAAGYVIVPLAAQQARQAFDARLRAEGVEPSRIGDLAADADRVEGNQVARALNTVRRGASAEESRETAREVRAFLYQRCAEAKQLFPAAFAESADEQRVFLGWIGLWLDYPLVEEADFYLYARGSCSEFLPAYDSGAAIDRLVRPFSEEPVSSTDSLRSWFRDAYRNGMGAAGEFDATQCRRLVNRADVALTAAWSAHFAGVPPYAP
ncbi:MAG: hypothetical protein EON87_04445 [Brevundimonas sp.]|nr:MAG: hypothetical protein EON87_04445 [Brevundimonas sp.]